MIRSTAAWEKDLKRIAPGSPLYVAVAEVVRLRIALEDWSSALVEDNPAYGHPTWHAIEQILDGEEDEDSR